MPCTSSTSHRHCTHQMCYIVSTWLENMMRRTKIVKHKFIYIFFLFIFDVAVCSRATYIYFLILLWLQTHFAPTISAFLITLHKLREQEVQKMTKISMENEDRPIWWRTVWRSVSINVLSAFWYCWRAVRAHSKGLTQLL